VLGSIEVAFNLTCFVRALGPYQHVTVIGNKFAHVYSNSYLSNMTNIESIVFAIFDSLWAKLNLIATGKKAVSKF
jgi:hypothetical protein